MDFAYQDLSPIFKWPNVQGMKLFMGEPLSILTTFICAGEAMHCDEDSQHDDPFPKYIWWFDTYPMEFCEFLLVTALTRGVWLHPLSANDLGFQHIDIFADDIHDSKIGLF